MRKITELNDNWTFYKDTETLEAAGEKTGEPVLLPHTWNAEDGQDGGNDYFRGTCLYQKTLTVEKPVGGEQLFLEFDGVAMSATVLANGTELGRHEGGYSRFRVELTDAVQVSAGTVELAVFVNNGIHERVYPQSADFTFYGGIYRSVRLIRVPAEHFALDYCGGNGLRVVPTAAGTEYTVEVTAYVTGGNSVTFTIPEADVQAAAPVEDGCAQALLTIPHARLWQGREDPFLYTLKAGLPGDEVLARFGCRDMKIDPQKGFLLNGKEYPLRGVSRHQDRRGAGNALTLDMHREDLDLILEMGANSIRLAHYQHAQEFYDLCDEAGIVVWAEIPYITRHMPDGRGNTLQQMKELIIQNHHHACVAVWGLSNEITAASTVDEDLLENHHLLNELAHELDPTRPTTTANVFMLKTDSELLSIPDATAYNLYYGWYLGKLSENEAFFDKFHAEHPDLPIGFSEYGADANRRFHSAHPSQGDYTEEYQCVYHEHLLKMIEDRPWLWCTYVWNMFDFAADGRDEGGEHGLNQKGLVTFDRKERKDAYYLYKAHWSKEPFLHLCSTNYTRRSGAETPIKVYSNLEEITLMVNGEVLETQKGEHVFNFTVPLTGTLEISAMGAGLCESLTIQKVDQEDAAYTLAADTDGVVKNWFDDIALDPNCFSIEDNYADLMADEDVRALLEPMMEKMTASRGDVAKQVSTNPILQQMMSSMTLSNMLKYAKDSVSEEQINALNAALQKIPKKGNDA